MTTPETNTPDTNINNADVAPELLVDTQINGTSRVGLTLAYLLLLIALATGISAILAYAVAWKIERNTQNEQWILAHARWIMRNSLIFLALLALASIWFSPLLWTTWNADILTKSSIVLGSVILLIAFLYLLNAWLKGVGKLLFKKAVF